MHLQKQIDIYSCFGFMLFSPMLISIHINTPTLLGLFKSSQLAWNQPAMIYSLGEFGVYMFTV